MHSVRAALFLLTALVCAGACAGETPVYPIRTAAQFATWRENPPAESPLDALSPGARERFLAGLSFGRSGLAGFDTTDLALELDSTQIREVLAMFGDDIVEYARHLRPADSRSHAVAIRRRAGISAVERGFNRFFLHNQGLGYDDDIAREAATVDAYHEDFPALDAVRLRALDDSDLQLWLRAALDAGDKSAAQDIGTAALQAWNEYERRGLAADTDIARVFNLLLATRQFDAAADFAKRHPGANLPALPRLRMDTPTKGPGVWEFGADGREEMRLRGLDLRPLQIIVTAGCHFSADAAEDITRDATLGPVFRKYAHWLSLPPGIEDLDALRDWNRKFPQAQMLPIHSRAEWAIIPAWRMPTFHIVRDGKVIDSVVGWSRDEPGTREALVAALKRAGLLD